MNKRNIVISVIILVISFLSFTYGFISYHYKIFPYNYIKQYYGSNTQYNEYPDNISELIEIENEEDILKKRNELIQYIWKQGELPTTKYPSVEKGIKDKRYSNLKNLDRIDKLTVNMDYGINSIMYHFHPLIFNNKLIIYHQGHTGDFVNGYDYINKFLDNGYDVIAISMPLLGMNNQPKIRLKRFGEITFSYHNQLELIDTQNFSSIKFFIEPVIAIVNYAKLKGYKEVSMVGISGGGWTTVISAAIDVGILKSYQIASSYPIYLRTEYYGESYGDYEQVKPGLYKIANYLELYILGSYGNGRKQTQILNVYDSDSFSGYKYLSYRDIVYEKMKILGNGEFVILTDDTHNGHKISKTTLNFIIDDISKN